MTTNRFYIEGNGGGDHLIITPTKDENVVHIEVGHCCVVYLSASVPVEFLTAVLAEYDTTEKIKQKLIDVWQYRGWGKELAEKVHEGYPPIDEFPFVVGDRVVITLNERATGISGGWHSIQVSGRITKVNRVTARVHLDQYCYGREHTLPFERIQKVEE